MADINTRKTTASVSAFLKSVDHAKRREDALSLKAFMNKITG